MKPTFGLSLLLSGIAGLLLSLCGCSAGISPQLAQTTTSTAMALSGNIHGGQQPVSASQVYLYQVSSQNGGSATSLLTSGFVLTDTNGNFSITLDYACPTGAYVYLLALGGNPGLGLGGSNSEIALAAGLGPCSSLSASSFFVVNEVTTAAFAYAMSAYATSDTQVGTTASLAAPFAYLKTVVNPASGMALGSTATLTLPQQALNSLANSIAACVNSSGAGTPCSTLMTASGASTANTFQAALNIAQSPGKNVATIYGLAGSTPPFQPTLSSAPASWTLAATSTSGQILADANTYTFTTPLGTMCVEMRPDIAPLTVANFRYYVNNGSWTSASNMFLHRSQAGFVTQGGGYTYSNGSVSSIATTSPVTNEYNLPNTRGTIAMATSYGSPNSATDQWFFNDVDNSTTLDAQNGSYTAFGSIVGVMGYASGGCSSTTAGLAVMDAVNQVPTYDFSAQLGPAFNTLPLINYTGTFMPSNLVTATVAPANPM